VTAVRVLLLIADLAAVGSAAVLLLLASIGGFDVAWGPLSLRVNDFDRPIIVLVASTALQAQLLRRARPDERLSRVIPERAAVQGLVALLLAAGATYVHVHVRSCGGLDSYGYVSAASLVAEGRLIEPQPLARLLPFPEASRAATPLAYVVAPDGESRAPRFPLGLPLVMAVFKVFGPEGPFFAPLTMAVLTLLVVFLLARQAESPRAGLFAAAIVAVDPVFVDLAIQPMSDVPAACWLLIAVWLRVVESRWPVLAGVAAGMAFLTRPALITAVVALFGLTARRSRDTWWFGATLAMALLVQAVLNVTLYGGVWSSGYGRAAEIFVPARLAAAATNIVTWVTYVHTPIFWIAWIASLWVMSGRRWVWQVSGVAVACALPYLLYIVYDDWESTRFLLPGIVLVLVVASCGVERIVSRTMPAWRGLALLALALACAFASHRFLGRHQVFDLARGEAKYPLVGAWVRDRTPARAVVLASLHSGSIRYYAGRETVRWDEIPPGALRATLKSLQEAGRGVYLALDAPSEPDAFDLRFRAELGAIEMAAVGRVREVSFFRLAVP
jgi:hypothetical protein